MAFKWYLPADPLNPLYDTGEEFNGTFPLVHPSDLSDGMQIFQLHFADVEADPGDSGLYKVEAANDWNGDTLIPGSDQIKMRPVDNDPGNGHATSEVKLALTQAGLTGAVAGAELQVGTQILSGASNALVLFVGVTNAVTTDSNSTELRIARIRLRRSSTA